MPADVEDSTPEPFRQAVSKDDRSVLAEPDPINEASITFKYITLDLLKRAASSFKKTPLTTLITSFGIKSSNNVANNKKKLCDLLETCESIGSKFTVSLVTHLINKVEDNVIRMELLANYLPLSISAQERKKALVSFCKSQSTDKRNLVKLVFDNLDKEASRDTRRTDVSHLQVPKSHDEQSNESAGPTNDHITPEAPLSGGSETEFNFVTDQSRSCA